MGSAAPGVVELEHVRAEPGRAEFSESDPRPAESFHAEVSRPQTVQRELPAAELPPGRVAGPERFSQEPAFIDPLAADHRSATQSGLVAADQPAFRPVAWAQPSPNGLSDYAAALREARLFRAALADAFESRLASLARGLAIEVLGRELLLAPADLATLARRLLHERAADGPLRLRVAPADADIACEVGLVADPGLQPGDAVLECREGDINARLRIRLENVWAATS